MIKKKVYTLEEFKSGKIAIHVKTQREYNKLMRRLEKVGYLLNNTKPTKTNLWFGNQTCIGYGFPDFPVEESEKALSWAHTNSYKCQGCTIIKPHEINLVEDKPVKRKSDLEKQIERTNERSESLFSLGFKPKAYYEPCNTIIELCKVELIKEPKVKQEADTQWELFLKTLEELENKAKGMSLSELKKFIKELKGIK